MDIRCRSLPPGWYPGNRDEIIQAIAGWKAAGPVVSSAAIAAIAPHAGWYFSGRLAWAAWQAANEADTVIILGGHRSAGTRLLVSMHDAFDTPLGPIEADDETRSMLFDGLATEPTGRRTTRLRYICLLRHTVFRESGRCWQGFQTMQAL